MVVSNILSADDWAEAFSDVQTVVHLLALAHDKFPADEIDAVNRGAAIAAAEGARKAGVRKFIFVSTAHVFGGASTAEIVTDATPRNPKSHYAIAKAKAEDAILGMSASFAEGTVALRPPLVYGPNPKGNVLRMIQAIERGFPLPIATWMHRRSMVGTTNLADAILAAASRPLTSGAYIVCDARALTLAETARALADGLGCKARLFALPLAPIRALSALPGIGGLIDKLTGPLVYDGKGFYDAAQWSPPLEPEQGLREAAMSRARGAR